MESFIKALPDQLSYPEKTQMMWQHFTGIKFDGNTPNHVLALAYAKAAAGKILICKRLNVLENSIRPN